MIYKLTKTTFIQESSVGHHPEDIGWRSFDQVVPARNVKISHVVNFYRATGVKARVQALTAQSMSRAAARVRDLKLLAVALSTEGDSVPHPSKPRPRSRRL
jgi:hypothetical protein